MLGAVVVILENNFASKYVCIYQVLLCYCCDCCFALKDVCVSLFVNILLLA